MRRTTLFAAVSPVAVGLTILAAAGSVAAQEASAEAVQEVIVTSNRVDQAIQDVPVAVNVLNAQQLEDRRIESVGDVLAYTPGAQSFGSDPSNQNVFIRGVGSDLLGASADPAVVTMVDGAVLSRTWMRPGAIFDLNRVEVARGPQGTTFGRNATAGVIHFVSNRPRFDNEAMMSVDVGNYDLLEAQAVVNRRISDKLAARLAIFGQQRDGYFSDERDPDNTLGDRTTIALRGQLLYRASENLEFLLRGSYSDEHNDEPSLSQIRDPSRPVNYRGLFTFQPLDADPRTVQTTNQRWDRQLWDVNLEAVYRAGDLTFTWNNNFARGELPSYSHPWGIPQLAYKAKALEEADVFQSELRVDNSASESPLQWVGGLYYLNEDIVRQEEKEIMVGYPLQTFHDFQQLNTTNSYGVFVNGQYTLPSKTTISAGARYSYDEKDYQVPFMTCSNQPNWQGRIPPPGGRGPICGAFLLNYNAVTNNFARGGNSTSWDNVSYRASITQAFGEDLNVYASYATAYKGGGFPNEPNSSGPEAFLPYNPETVKTIEVGVKGALWERRLRFELAAFDSTYDDRQDETILPGVGTNVVFNQDSASIRGFEGQAEVRLTDRLTVMGNVTFLDHKDDVTGAPLTGLMDWTAFVAASYEQPLANGSSLRFSADLRARDQRLTGDTPPLVVPGETLLGANLTWTAPGDDLSIQLWARNLTNELDIQALSAATVLGDQGTLTAGAPRTVGVTLRSRF